MTTAQDTTTRELAELLSIKKIERVLFDYAYYLDMNLPDDLAALFTEDCYVAYGPNFGADGRKAYRETLDGIGTFFTATSHHVSNVVVDFSDDLRSAKVRSVLYAWHRYTKEGKADGYFFGQYHDEFVFDDTSGWLFTRRELRASGVTDFHVKKQIPIGRASA
ncbi:nuclear transport factor 2 family protein [Antrihabitans stalactiti]|uniref:Nuclear transport factor 2 family protein n=1 Tax=Antrihabitans stalactiti TaxID=2584121 RepID=A0A848KH87_9NOCA|nr:nuclear transport factor 2 family protein [Antrihabitans stalactiti]NMN97521.1 nuclear transport factor 2 family protein [Antrihabitans stalactiti]